MVIKATAVGNGTTLLNSGTAMIGRPMPMTPFVAPAAIKIKDARTSETNGKLIRLKFAISATQIGPVARRAYHAHPTFNRLAQRHGRFAGRDEREQFERILARKRSVAARADDEH
jgi:hypothetical protein